MFSKTGNADWSLLFLGNPAQATSLLDTARAQLLRAMLFSEKAKKPEEVTPSTLLTSVI
jgi:hypothetical protein